MGYRRRFTGHSGTSEDCEGICSVGITTNMGAHLRSIAAQLWIIGAIW